MAEEAGMKVRALVATSLVGVLAMVLSGCVAQPPDAIGTAHYGSGTVEGDPTVQAALRRTSVRLWFEQGQNELDMIAVSPVNAYTVPVTLRGHTILSDVGRIRGTAVGCAGVSPGCTVEGWLSGFVMKPLTYDAEGSTLRLSSGGVTLQLHRL